MRESVTRVLYVGETWQGSSARSLREAMAQVPGVEMSDIGEDQYVPRYRGLRLRIVNRLNRGAQVRELRRRILDATAITRPSVVVVYKGATIDADVIGVIQRAGIPVVNVFPDCSPHAFGRSLREAMGHYDLVMSTKPFHPQLWTSLYGYRNRCVFLPHGYDPAVHLWGGPAVSHSVDVALCATWRPEYHELMASAAKELGALPITVAIAGAGWRARRRDFPSHWNLIGSVEGRAYGHFLRAARIVVAPVTRRMVVDGVCQPGDVDSTRTYELAAAYCFFVHRRTEYALTRYDEATEVPMWEDSRELAALLRRWLPDSVGRAAMAARAHARAVPAYSITASAAQAVGYVAELLEGDMFNGRRDGA